MANIMRLGGGSGGGKPKKLLSSLTEGSLVSVLEDGKLTPFYVAKHNYEADLNGEGRTLLLRKDLHSIGAWNSTNVNAYAGSTVDTWLNGDYMDSLSSQVKANISVTTFEYTAGNGANTVTTLQRSIFLPSVTEMGLVYSSYYNVEGEAFPIANSVQIGYLNGTAKNYWVRNPFTGGKDSALFVSSTGTAGAYGANDTSTAYRPCFTLPDTMALNEAPNADGSWTLADEVTIDTETATTTAKAGVNYTNGIADLTPSQLHEIAGAISSNPNINKDTSVVYYDKGNMHRKISTGDTHEISFSGTAYTTRISGFNHYDLAFGTVYGKPTATGKVGILLEMVDCLAGKFQMNTSNTNSGGWASCYLRNSIIPALLEQIPDGLLSAMKMVKILTSAGSNSSTITVTTDKMFAPSEVEIFGTTTFSFAGEGSQYAYYKAGNSKIKTVNGSAIDWWERSPLKTNSTSFCRVNVSGGADGRSAADAIGNAFAYCI